MDEFREFQDYWFNLQEKIDAYGTPIQGERLQSDKFEPHELISQSIASLGDPGYTIYEKIDEHGEAKTIQFLIEDSIRRAEPEKAGLYWEKFEEADKALRNPEDSIFSRLEESGMAEEKVDYVRRGYQLHIEPLLDGSTFN